MQGRIPQLSLQGSLFNEPNTEMFDQVPQVLALRYGEKERIVELSWRHVESAREQQLMGGQTGSGLWSLTVGGESVSRVDATTLSFCVC